MPFCKTMIKNNNILPFTWIVCALLVAAAAIWVPQIQIADAQSSGSLVAIVNDEPISEYDVSQRVQFNKTMRGARGGSLQLRQEALRELIDNTLKRQEAERFSLGVTDLQVDQSLEGMAARAGASTHDWSAGLRSEGIEIKTVREEIQSSLAWRRVVTLRFGRRIQVETEDVDREYQVVEETSAQVRYVYVIQRILLPLESDATSQLRQARLRDAHTVMGRISGCRSISNATSGVFNKRIFNAQRIPAEGLSGPLKRALDQVGPGHAIGPAPDPGGVLVIVYCNRESIEAPRPTREQVEDALLQRKFDRIGEQFLRDLRRDAIIEYRDPELAS